MNNQPIAVLSLLAISFIAYAASLPAKKSSNEARAYKDELMFLAKMLAPMRELSKRAGEIEGLVSQRAQNDRDFATELHKRQQQWEVMDYGWGGGRFGKRAQEAPEYPSNKRYDAYGSYGRFGRDVDHVDSDNTQ